MQKTANIVNIKLMLACMVKFSIFCSLKFHKNNPKIACILVLINTTNVDKIKKLVKRVLWQKCKKKRFNLYALRR